MIVLSQAAMRLGIEVSPEAIGSSNKRVNIRVPTLSASEPGL
jgi:hypothetical protein